MRRITLQQSQYYLRLDQSDPRVLERAVAFTVEPSGDGIWEDVTYYGEAMMDPTGTVRKPEWVYVLVNKSLPGICKIGMTTTSVSQRVSEINASTGVITPWFCVYKYRCFDSMQLERKVHDRLGSMGYRVNPKREGFECTTQLAASLIEEIGDGFHA